MTDSPKNWLVDSPLTRTEKLYAIFSSASCAEPLNVWRRSKCGSAPIPVWGDTVYTEWKEVMPYVGIVDADSEFLQWVANSESRDWGWLAVSSASLEVVVEHLRSLTQVTLPDGKVVFFRFWDGRYLLPILRSAEVEAAELVPVIQRCWINGESVEIGGSAVKTQKAFPWWEVPEAVLQHLAAGDDSARIGNLMQWLSEEQPGVFEAFLEAVLHRKVANFLKAPDSPAVPKEALLAYLVEEMQ
ncbi:DUF4123 domain-containing protein [Pseudomonas sp. G(2018)]|uniref:DUF4123 domain-containing protein n=1 Tax=Pseudomonas sp. G(2018) TaxID=2502242 RepID=UPI0010F70EC3|nr:DUF4123 domain-containing protein [Pseudomonas sp. G(2018)]